MRKEKNFGCFRYFLVPYDQISIFQMQMIDRKVLIENLIDNTETAVKIEDNTYEGKLKLYLVYKIDSDNYLLKFGRHGQITYTADTGNDFKESQIDDHPYIHIFINTKEQIILLENKTKVFKDFNHSSNAICKYFTERVDRHGYEFKTEEITSPKKFWSLIESAESIETISLTIYSPNLFDGNTPAESAAKEFEEVTNSTENTLTFKNKHGKLKLMKNKLQSFIDYISCGGGNWFIKARIPNMKKQHFSSKKITKIIHMPEDIFEKGIAEISQYISVTMASINHKPGDDDLNEDKDIKSKGDKEV